MSGYVLATGPDLLADDGRWAYPSMDARLLRDRSRGRQTPRLSAGRRFMKRKEDVNPDLPLRRASQCVKKT